MATRIITIDGKKIRHERITKKNGKVYDYFYEVTQGGKKKGQKLSFKNIYGSSLQVKRAKEAKYTTKDKIDKILDEFGDTPTTRRKLKNIEGVLERQGKTLNDIDYKSIAARMYASEDNKGDIYYSELDRAKKMIRNLGYTEEEFQNMYGISAEQLSHAKTADGEITIGDKVYALKWNYTGYDDLVLLRTL